MARKAGRQTALLTAGAFALLWFLERRRPLRRAVDPARRRLAHNAAMAALTAAVTAPLQSLLVRRALGSGGGLLRRADLPRPVRFAAGFLLLDYSLWWWHRLNHVWPLWRFHAVHHADPDLDTATSIRFHAGEMLPSAFFRAAQIRLFGVDRRTFEWWQRMLLLSIIFHHSNLRLPERLERALVRVIVTPRMHGIHHSDVEAETNSNWSALLSVWDVLHGTFLWDVPQEAIRIGVPRRRSRALPPRDPRPHSSVE